MNLRYQCFKGKLPLVFRKSNLALLLMLVLALAFSMQTRAKDLKFRSTDKNSTGEVFTEVQQQGLKISGTVYDAGTGEKLIGVSILIVGTSQGAVTDAKGNFTLTVPGPNSELRVSYMGYVTQVIPVKGQLSLVIRLVSEAKKLDEIVVVGYGTQKKESVVGAITQVDNKALMKSGTTNITNAITGKLSGILTIQNTGEPGNNYSEIIIRGISSWNGSAPLVQVDGVERDFRDLDPNEVSSISVLKDASATAVFGAKGANGVIIVTTKRGTLGKPQMQVTASYGVDRATRIPDFIDSYTTMSMLNTALMNGQQFTELIPQSVLNEYKHPSTPLKAIQYPNVDWFKMLTRQFAPTANANFNIHGGTNFIRYFGSLGWTSDGDFFNTYHSGYDDTRYKFNRFNYRANFDFKLTSTTQLSLNVGGSVGIKNQPHSSAWRGLYQTSPAVFPAYFPAWVLQQVPDPDYPNATGDRLAFKFDNYSDNPYTTMHNGQFDQYLASRLFTDLILDQKLDGVLKGLSVKGKASFSTFFRNRSLYADPSFPQYRLHFDLIGVPGANPWERSGEGNEVYNQAPLDINVGSLESDYYRDLYYEGSLNYINSFGKHTVTALALMNRQQKNSSTDFPYYNEALVGRATYDFAHRYLLEFNIGYTGSERFSPHNRFGTFPSGAIGWVASEERFFKKAVPWMNRLKFRYSDGLVGSDYASSRWLYMSDFYTYSGYIREDKGANVNAQWEQARKRDLGMEIGVFNDLFTLNVDLFDEYRDKMLLTPRSVTMLVGNSFKDLNLGKMKKHGFEVELGFNKTTSTHFNYYVKGLLGFNENRIIFKDDPLYTPEYQKDKDKPVDAQLSGVQLTGTGYFTTVDDIHNNPTNNKATLDMLNTGDYKYLDYNADGTISILDKYPIPGSDYPPITYSLSGGFNYKGFEFNLMFQGNKGKYVEFNQTFEYEFDKGDYRVHASQLDYWTPNHQNVNHATLHYSKADIMNLSWGGGEADRGFDIMIENRIWRNADYLRLKEVYLSYTFNTEGLKKIAGVRTLQVYATGNNVVTFTKLIEGDPERKDFNQGFYPQMSSYILGLKLGF